MSSTDKIYRKLVKKVSKSRVSHGEFMVKIKCKNTDTLDGVLHLFMYNHNCDIVCTSGNAGNMHTIQIIVYDPLDSGVESRFLKYA